MNSKILCLIIFLLLFLIKTGIAQTINWGSLKPEEKNIVQLNAGFDYALTFGATYGYQSKLYFPVVYHAEVSLPAGEKLFDDIKTKIGIQASLFESNQFRFNVQLDGVFRTYENEFVQMLNFGSDFSGTIGYYKLNFFAAAEVGFDKAIVTHFKQSDFMLEIYPGAQSGWYQPATGGNFYYGLQGGISFNKYDITLEAGKVMNENFDSTPLIPYYAQLSLGRRF